MIAERIFDWANRTPNKTAIIHNGRAFSYRAFARLIASARGYFIRRDCIGPGCAVLSADNLMHFWVISLALRSLGLTTITLQPTTTVGELGLPDVRFVVTSGLRHRPDLEGVCVAHRLKLLTVSLEGETALELDTPRAFYPTGGHILQTSGTTGASKMVLMSPAVDAVFLPRKAQVIGMDSNTLLCVFGFPSWTAVGYRWAASPWTVGGQL